MRAFHLTFAAVTFVVFRLRYPVSQLAIYGLPLGCFCHIVAGSGKR